MCYRNENEAAMPSQTKRVIENILRKKEIKYSYTDMISQNQILAEVRKSVIVNKLKEFAGAQLVITDRLHGMVFCYLTNTPCIVFSNYNHKVLGTYEWIKDVNYIKPGDVEIIEQQIPEMLSLKEHRMIHVINEECYKEIEMRIVHNGEKIKNI